MVSHEHRICSLSMLHALYAQAGSSLLAITLCTLWSACFSIDAKDLAHEDAGPLVIRPG